MHITKLAGLSALALAIGMTSASALTLEEVKSQDIFGPPRQTKSPIPTCSPTAHLPGSGLMWQMQF